MGKIITGDMPRALDDGPLLRACARLLSPWGIASLLPVDKLKFRSNPSEKLLSLAPHRAEGLEPCQNFLEQRASHLP